MEDGHKQHNPQNADAADTEADHQHGTQRIARAAQRTGQNFDAYIGDKVGDHEGDDFLALYDDSRIVSKEAGNHPAKQVDDH